MSNKLPFLAFIALISLAFVAPATDCPPCDCATPTPPTTNPAKGTAGLQGGAQSLYNLGTGAGWYQWNPNPDVIDGFPAVPMIRDYNQMLDVITGTLTTGIASQYVLGFNEPDKCPDQACLSVQQVVQGQAIIEAMYPDRLIVSPAYSQDAYTQLETVRNEYIIRYGKPPRWDVLAAHCYFVSDPQPCIGIVYWHVEKAWEWEAGAVWVTEFAALAQTGSGGVVWEPAVQAGSAFIDYLEAQPLVTRYYWYPFGFEPYYVSALIQDGEFTPLGEMYRGK